MTSTHCNETGASRRLILCLIVGLLLLPVLAWSEVVLRIQWQFDGPPGELQEAIRKGVALQKRINPEVRHELWFDDVHGQSTPSASLLVFYRDMAHYGETAEREEADDEWNAYIQAFPAESFPTTFVGLSNTVIGDSGTAGGGEVLDIYVFQPAAGIDGLAEQVHKAASILKTLGIDAHQRLSTAMIAGSGQGAVVTVRHPSIGAYGRNTQALQESDAWQSFLADFPSDQYPMVYRGLSRSVAIQ